MDSQFDLTSFPGLSGRKAANRLKQEGYNEIPSMRKRSVFYIAYKIISEPMFLMLIAGGILYFILGDMGEALILLSFVFVIMGITFYQEHKTERALEALRDLSSPRALVIRGGKEKRIAGREVVREDILIVREGDYVPADAELLFTSNLSVDESLLTGESVPVGKNLSNGASEIYSGTLVVRGYGIARVRSIGAQTEIGKIGKALQTVESEQTPLQKMTGKLVRNLAIIGLSFCILVIIIYGFRRGDWLDGILAGITLAMAILPEEFPVILTTFLALGAWRISKSQVLTRRVPAVEALGSASVLCADKTGTLTRNEMAVSEIFAAGKFYQASFAEKRLPQDFQTLVQFGVLASQRDPFDPMEKAIKHFGLEHLPRIGQLYKKWHLVREYPLSEAMLALSHVWKLPNQSGYEIAAKGAPEAIMDLCHFNENQIRGVSASIQKMAKSGLRVIGVAKAKFLGENLPEGQHDFKFEFLGLIGLADPIRKTVPEAIRQCYRAGIRVIMITGDYAVTARNIGRQIGLRAIDKIISGDELDQMTDIEICQHIKTTNIFARIVPRQKLRIVRALKAIGETVVMTGDGVNDAPALKSAHIGVAMGERGTDVARESSEIVLLDDDFSSIVKAVSLGRRIFDNIKKAMTYTLAIHISIIGVSLLPVLLKWPLILMPVHIVFLELIIDPACSLVFESESEEKDNMDRPPRDPKEPLFNKQILKMGFLQGFGALFIALAVLLGAKFFGYYKYEQIRALTFTTLVIVNLALIFTNRSWTRSALASLRTPNRILWWVIGGASGFLSLVLFLPFLRRLFRFSPLSISDLAVCLIMGICSLLYFEIIKKLRPVVH